MKAGELGRFAALISTSGRPRYSTRMIDKFAIVPISACVSALIVFPLLDFFTYSDPHTPDGRPEIQIFWPATAAIFVVLAVQIVLVLTCARKSSVCSRILRLLERASSGLSTRSACSLNMFRK
jgi:hypothetical protein